MTRSGGWSPHEQGFVSALVRRDGRQDVPQPRESARKPGGGPSLRAGLRAPTPGLQSGEEKTPVLDTAPCEAVCRGGPNSASASAVEVIRFLLTGLVSLWRSPRAGRQGSVIVFHKISTEPFRILRVLPRRKPGVYFRPLRAFHRGDRSDTPWVICPTRRTGSGCRGCSRMCSLCCSVSFCHLPKTDYYVFLF